MIAVRTVGLLRCWLLPAIQPIRREPINVRRRQCAAALAGPVDVPVARLPRNICIRDRAPWCKLHEYQPQVLHAKLVIIDDLVYVGSSNLDRRSPHINNELMLRPIAGTASRPERCSKRIWLSQRGGRRARRAPLVERWRSAWATGCSRLDPLVARRSLRALN
jgi:hypothetical protein